MLIFNFKILRKRKTTADQQMYQKDILLYEEIIAKFFCPTLRIEMCYNSFHDGIYMEDLRFYNQTVETLCVEFKPKLGELYAQEYCRFCCLFWLRNAISSNALSYCPYKYFSPLATVQERTAMLVDLFQTKFLKINHGNYELFFKSEFEMVQAIVMELAMFDEIFDRILKLFSKMPNPTISKDDDGTTMYRYLAAIRDKSLMITFCRDETKMIKCRIIIIDLDDKTRHSKLLEHQFQNNSIAELLQQPNFHYPRCIN